MKAEDYKCAQLRLSREEFESLSAYFNAQAGLAFDESALALFEQRLGPRLRAHGLDSFADYQRLLRFGERARQEREEAWALVTTGETYFFRHEEQLDLLSRRILPELSNRNAKTRRLSVWSAGCSTGEEVYTLAMLIAESGLFEDWNVCAMGCDISARRVEQARQGCYGKSSFRATSPSRKRRFFEEQSDGSWKVRPEIANQCEFRCMNLLDRSATSWVGRVDVVLCRNVLIYLDDGARHKVIDNLHARLVPGGYLMLGHSESLQSSPGARGFRRLEKDLAYRRPALSRGERP